MKRITTAEIISPSQAPRSVTTPKFSNRFSLPPVIVMPLMIGVGIACAFSWERFAPIGYKPSDIIGSFDARITAQVEEAKVREQARGEAFKKSMEIAVMQSSEQYKAQIQLIAKMYEALYKRAEIELQMYADMQKKYFEQRMQLSQRLNGGEIALANLASLSRMFGLLSGNQELAKSSEAFLRSVKDSVDADLRGTTQGMRKIDIEGFRAEFPAPADFQAELEKLDPAKLIGLDQLLQDLNFTSDTQTKGDAHETR